MKKQNYLLFLVSFFVVLHTGCMEEMPGPDSDPWKYAFPAEALLTPADLTEMDSAIQVGNFGEIHSLLIIKKDNIVYEQYYNGFTRDALHPMDAITKSVVSALFGALMLEDTAVSVDDLLVDVLPQYGVYFDNIPQKDRIRIRDIMSNASGLWWEEWTMPYTDPSNDAAGMAESQDWSAWTLSKPMIREPGFEFEYNSGNAILMGPVIQSYTGTTVEEFARTRLFEPLGIKNWDWQKTNDGTEDTAWGLSLRPLDLAKIGYLFVKGGVWNDTQIFDESWVRQSTRYREAISNYFHYSYQWWRLAGNTDIIRMLETRGLPRNDVFFAWGRGDQLLFVSPSLELVVVVTAGNNKNYQTAFFSLLLRYIIPSILYNSFLYP